MLSGRGISEYVIRIGLYRLLSNIIIGSNFSSKRIFVSDYFGAECCCKLSNLDWSQNQLKKYRSGSVM